VLHFAVKLPLGVIVSVSMIAAPDPGSQPWPVVAVLPVNALDGGGVEASAVPFTVSFTVPLGVVTMLKVQLSICQ